VAVATSLGGVEDLEEEVDWWEEHAAPIEAAMEAGDLPGAIDAELAIWAPMGTADEPGRRIREIAMDNIHELTMDESSIEELDPPAALRLGEIDVPTLVVVAERDPSDMHRAADLVAKGVLDGRSVSIEADHVVNLRNPQAFDAAVLPFLASVLV
ncbi:MAG TPA: alpha/beta hydrolase, partial [Actinomycetota bacterium]